MVTLAHIWQIHLIAQHVFVSLLVLFLARIAEKVTLCAQDLFCFPSAARFCSQGQESCQACAGRAAPLTLTIAFVSMLIKSPRSCCEVSPIIMKVRIYGEVLGCEKGQLVPCSS